MTPQSSFMVVAPIDPDRMDALKDLLRSMNDPPGMATPRNSIIPFGDFKKLHYARFVILDDQTLNDFERIGELVPDYPVTLAFMGDCDGPADEFLADMARRAETGLRQAFSHCLDFGTGTDLLQWMKRHSTPPAAAYVNHIGRTVCQIHQEATLRVRLIDFLKTNPPTGDDPQGTRDKLIDYARQNDLIPVQRELTPIGWWVRNFLHATTVPAAILLALALILLPLGVALAIAFGIEVSCPLKLLALGILLAILIFVLAILIFVIVLRVHEKVEPEIVSRPADDYAKELAALEDHDVVNQFSLMGSVKPSAFRRRLLVVILWAVDWVARHIYNRGNLARIRSIHFARWVLLDGNRRVMFASSYDGSLESYNDDFINKAGFGLNLAFGSGFGYPRTNWLMCDGAKDEQKFKYTLRRHQLPTQIWYNAYPSLTVYDLARNSRVRQGIESGAMSDVEIRAWLADL
jgi:hypothetical protein